jgi:hypothetical protein
MCSSLPQWTTSEPTLFSSKTQNLMLWILGPNSNMNVFNPRKKRISPSFMIVPLLLKIGSPVVCFYPNYMHDHGDTLIKLQGECSNWKHVSPLKKVSLNLFCFFNKFGLHAHMNLGSFVIFMEIARVIRLKWISGWSAKKNSCRHKILLLFKSTHIKLLIVMLGTHRRW